MVPSLSIVIPVYNSEDSLPLLLERLETVLPTLAERYEAILVNDGSRDHSWERIQELQAQYPWMRGMCLMRNYGQHNALLCGIRAARHEMIVTMDDDLQNPPEEIAKLLAKLQEGFDVVYGPPEREQHGLWRDLASQMTKIALQNAMGAQTARQVSAFRAFRTQLREAFADYRSPYVSIDVLLTWASTRFAAVRVRHDERRLGRSNYTLRKLVIHALNMMTGFSILPLQIASIVGFVFMLFGVAIMFFTIGRYLISGGVVPGFSFLACTIAIFSGTQLFALGIFGEYLARIHYRTMSRPVYAVRETTKSDPRGPA